MRKSLLFLMLVLLAVPSIFAGRKKEKAGDISDYVYTDKKFNFSLKLNEEWKPKIQKNDEDFRLSLTQVNYGIPPEYVQTPDYTKIPRMVVFVVESDLPAKLFVDSLVSDTYKSDAKKELMKEFEILNMTSSTGFKPEKLLTRQKKSLDIGEEDGAYWTGQVKYTNEVATSASSIGGKRVKGGYGGGIAAVKKGKNMIVFHVISEWNYFEPVFDEALKIITSLKFE